MSTITALVGGDGITTANSMTKINTNFSNLNTDKIETSYLDTDTTLAANSDTKIATQKAVKAYVDTGGNTNASETTRGIVEEATDAEVVARTATGATGAKLFITPAKIGNVLKFGGTGADGALAITSGATNIDLAGAKVVTKNYTSISITGTGQLTFSNPHSNGTVIILKSQGNVTITSSTLGAIDATSIGGDGGTAGTSNVIIKIPNGVSGGIGAGKGVGGTAPGVSVAITKLPLLCCGGGGGGGDGTNGTNFGGGGGASAINNGSSAGSAGTVTGTGGSAGRGGGALYIECAGAYSCSSTLYARGGAGGQGTSSASGGGGGGGGCIVVRYNTLTSDTGTYTVTGGAGGAGIGGSAAGAAGATGYSDLGLNTEFS